MELYRTYPKFVTLWCCLETVLFAGQLFGWSCLLYVLKNEGFYDYACVSDTWINGETSESANQSALSIMIHVKGDNLSFTNDGFNPLESELGTYRGTTRSVLNLTETLREKEPVIVTCLEQDSRLNLWFSIAICFSYAMCLVLGPFLQKVGMRYFRIVMVATYVAGAFCIAFATKVTPWLICPGLCMIGVSGMALYSTNVQMSFLFPRVQSTITSLFVGLYDASTVVTQLVKTGFEHGLQRQHSFIILAVIHTILVGTSTMVFLPSVHVSRGTKRPNRDTKTNHPKPGAKSAEDKHSDSKLRFIRTPEAEHKKSLGRTIASGQYMLHVYWMCVQAIRFVTFLGFLNAWLVSKFHGDRRKESQFLGAFSYITLGTVFSALTAGMLHDCERKRFQNANSYRSKKMPIVLPLIVTTCLSILTTSLMYIDTDAVLYLIFILFTVYRSYLFSFEVTFLNDVFPLEYFAVLFGVLHSSAGLAGMVQHPLFGWYRSYQNAPLHINLFLIGLELSSLVHPFFIWYKCRNHQLIRKEDVVLLDKLTVHV